MGFDSLSGVRDFSLLNSSGAHPTFYSADKRPYFSGIKWLEHEACHLPSPSAKFENV
jgi:hypothetical protein